MRRPARAAVAPGGHKVAAWRHTAPSRPHQAETVLAWSASTSDTQAVSFLA